nr:uncharacterized protein LOC117686981 [Crassostrea gigas]
MKVAIPLFCFGICLVVGAPEKTFPCNFNIYDKTKDGKITKAEFFEYTAKHGYNAEHSSLVFRTLDSNADGQIEVSEFVANVPTLQKLSLISRCKRFQITIIIKCCKSSALVGPMMTSNGLQRPDMISGSNLLQNQLG